MKIGGSSNSINFIEQKSNASTKKVSEELTIDSDTFSTSNLKLTDLESFSHSVGMIDTISNSLLKLSDSAKRLQSISLSYGGLDVDKEKLQSEFETLVENMQESIDSSVYNNTQLFYSSLSFSNEQSMPDFMLFEILGIDDLSVEDSQTLETFQTKLTNLQEQFRSEKNFLEHVSFNSLAALSYQDGVNKESFVNQEEKIQKLDKDEVQRAHNVNSLSSKISFLLED